MSAFFPLPPRWRGGGESRDPGRSHSIKLEHVAVHGNLNNLNIHGVPFPSRSLDPRIAAVYAENQDLNLRPSL